MTVAFTSVAHSGKVWFLFYEHAVDIVVVVVGRLTAAARLRAEVSYRKTR